MFKTFVGALSGEEGAAFLRPETAQGIFVNFKCSRQHRVRHRFALLKSAKASVTKSHHVTLRFVLANSNKWKSNFSVIPMFPDWYRYQGDRRMKWYTDLGLSNERLILREHDEDELSHYLHRHSRYLHPEGEYGELEGIAHRGDGRETGSQHQSLRSGIKRTWKPKHRGSGKDLTYRDDLNSEQYTPHVIEPSAGADRATGLPLRSLHRRRTAG